MAVKITDGWPAAVKSLTCLSEEEIISQKTERLKLIDIYFKERILSLFSRSLKQMLICTSFMEILEPDICDHVLMITNSKSVLNQMLSRDCFIFQESCGGYRLHFLFRSFLFRIFEESGRINKAKLYARYADCMINRGCMLESFEYYLFACRRDKAWQMTCFCEFGAAEYANVIIQRLSKSTEEDSMTMLKLAWAHYALDGVSGMELWLNRYDIRKKNSPDECGNSGNILSIFINILHPRITPLEIIDILKVTSRPQDTTRLPLITITQNMPSIFRGGIDFSRILPDINAFVKNLRQTVKDLLSAVYGIMEDILLAEAAYESNNIAKSLEIIQRAVDKCDMTCRSEIHFAALCQLCITQCALRQKSKCSQTIEKIEEMIVLKKASYLKENFEALRVRIMIRHGETIPSETWLSVYAPTGVQDIPSLQFIRLFSHFATACSLLRVKRYKEAIVFLSDFERLCKEYCRTADLAEIYVLKSIAYLKTGQLELSRNSMAAALSIGYSYGFIRIFLDNGDITEILDQFTHKGSEHPKCNIRYIKKLIYLLKTLRLSPGGVANELKSIRLSARQQYMLIYLSQNLTYAEICQKTNLKITTVRTHISNLYKKLGVSHKKEALEKALALGFIDKPISTEI